MNTTEKEVADALESLGYSNAGSTEAIPDIYRHPDEGMPKLCVRDLIYHKLTSREKIEGFIAERRSGLTGEEQETNESNK